MPRVESSTPYPEGGPGRHLKARLRAGEVLVAGMVNEYLRPSLMKLYSQTGFDFVYIEYEHGYFDMPAMVDSVLAARDNGLPVVAKTPPAGASGGRQAAGGRDCGHPAPSDRVQGAGRDSA